MPFIVATYVIASQPPERRPTGTPHARANSAYRHIWTEKNSKVNLYLMIKVVDICL